MNAPTFPRPRLAPRLTERAGLALAGANAQRRKLVRTASPRRKSVHRHRFQMPAWLQPPARRRGRHAQHRATWTRRVPTWIVHSSQVVLGALLVYGVLNGLALIGRVTS